LLLLIESLLDGAVHITDETENASQSRGTNRGSAFQFTLLASSEYPLH
jgi:hypothetical protein